MTGLELDALGKPLANHFLENPCYDWVLEFPKSPKRLNSPHYSYFPYITPLFYFLFLGIGA